jgi:hypothetical protein
VLFIYAKRKGDMETRGDMGIRNLRINLSPYLPFYTYFCLFTYLDYFIGVW